MKKKADPRDGTVLIVAPIGKDAALAAGVLQNEGIRAQICANLADLAARIGEETDVILVAEEALVANQLPVLLNALDRQPAWSDIPVVILTSTGGSDGMTLEAVDIFGPAGNVTLLERPLGRVTLVSVVRVALRARERQHEVRALIEQRETVLTGISDAFAALDRDWRYTFVNDKAAEYAQLPKEAMIGRRIWDIYPEAVGGTFYKAVLRAAETQTPQHFEQYYDRWKCWMETRVYPTGDGVAVFRANINERKEQEALVAEHDRKLQENETLLRLAIEAADAGTFDYYPLTGEVRWSNRCRELFGVSPAAELTYALYINAVHPDDRHIVSETVEAVRRAGSTGRYDIEYRVIAVEDGKERWVAEKGRALFDENGGVTRFIGTMLDVTERKNTELFLQRAKKEADEANRAKDQFLAMLSHELRTPLTPVLMTIASLQRDPQINDHLRHDLEVLQRNVELEALLIDDLLDLTRIAHGKLELHYDAVDIHASLEHALSITAMDIEEKNLTVSCHFDAHEHHSWADGARLQQVFWNLIKNAVKFTPPGGQLDLRTRNDNAHHIIVDVADSGIGIEPDVLPRIFDAFEQGGRNVTSQFGGLGLGLAISKRVVDMHGGTIGASSGGRGLGATFTVTLGAMETSLLDGPVYYPAGDAAAANRGDILLIEDHEDTARVLGRILESGGYAVTRAPTIAEAKQIASKQRFDVAISDLGLPDGSGLDLMRHLRGQHGLTGIALSGFGTEDDVQASLDAGFAEHLTKPVDWERLKASIERLIGSETRIAAVS